MTETEVAGTVHVVEDDRALADALSLLLMSRGLGAATHPSGEAFLATVDAAWPAGPACVLLDVRMHELSGIETFERLRARKPAMPAPVIFLTGHGDISMAVDAVKNGAFDFFEKPFNDNRLADRVVQALAESQSRLMQADSSGRIRTRLERLTSREKDVMALILKGKLNKIIADELGISMRTVEVHRSNVFSKMGVRSAVELARRDRARVDFGLRAGAHPGEKRPNQETTRGRPPAMRIRNHRDFWSGVLFIATGVLFMVLSRQYNLGTAAKMGPGYFPTILGGLMAALGVLIMLPAFSSRGPQVRVDKIDFKSIVLILVAVAVYAATLPKLGFIVSLFLLIMISSLASHEFKLTTSLISSVVLLLFSWLVFVKGLELQFPFLPTFLTR
jgi:two-component system, LuxR family, response regulator DctR